MQLRRAVTAADHDGIDRLQRLTLPSDKPLDSRIGDVLEGSAAVA